MRYNSVYATLSVFGIVSGPQKYRYVRGIADWEGSVPTLKFTAKVPVHVVSSSYRSCDHDSMTKSSDKTTLRRVELDFCIQSSRPTTLNSMRHAFAT